MKKGLNKKDFYKTYIRFNNPESGMLTYISEFKIIGEGQMKGLFDNKDYSYILLEENFSVPKLDGKVLISMLTKMILN